MQYILTCNLFCLFWFFVATMRCSNGNIYKNQDEQQKATKSIFHSHFYSFASTLDLWKVVDINSNEKPERATTANEKQQKATRSSKKQKRTSEQEKPKRTIKNRKRATKGTKSQNGNQT